MRAKEGGRPELFALFASHLAARIRGWPRPEGLALVPLPSHPVARWRRGFDPAAELARPLAEKLRLPVLAALSRRWVSPRHQKRRGRRERMALARSHFVARGRIRGRPLWLIDDVMTSGASVEAASRALRSAGAGPIRVAVWARTLENAT